MRRDEDCLSSQWKMAPSRLGFGDVASDLFRVLGPELLAKVGDVGSWHGW